MTDFRRYLHAHRVQVVLRVIAGFKATTRYSVNGLLYCFRDAPGSMIRDLGPEPLASELAEAIRDAHFEEMSDEQVSEIAIDARKCLRHDYGDTNLVWDDEPWFVR